MSDALNINRQLVIRQLHQLQDDLSYFYNHQDEDDARRWQLLFDLFFTKKTGRPTTGWQRKIAEILSLIPEEEYQEYTIGFLRKLYALLQTIHQKKTGSQLYFLHEKFQELFKGIIWAAARLDTSYSADLIESIGLECFRKIPGHGAVSIKLGNACLYCLSAMPFQIGIEKLLHFRSKITYPSVRKTIQKYLLAIATEQDKTVDQIEEMVISDFGLNLDYEIQEDFGAYQGLIHLTPTGRVTLEWYKKTGHIPVKTLSKSSLLEFNEKIKLFKKTAKSIKSYLSVQRDRLEGFYLRQRQWFFAEWKIYYLDNPLLRHLTNRLIWQFTQNDKTTSACYYNGQWQTAEGQVIDWITDQTIVTLWHPIDERAAQVLVWRNWLESCQIQQPFKQAYREIYLLTEAERQTYDYSNRFAAHILRQHQFAALCKVRNWRYKLKGQWENDSIPTLTIPVWEMSAEFWVEIDWEGEATDRGAFNLVFTDQVRFYHQDEQLEMDEIPPIVFSEVMRDVDLFVGVTSIGNDPTWQDNHEDHNDYWRQYSFSELSASANMRKAALERLIPRLNIARQCSFDGRFLVVKGQRRTYKIHIGSGNILMKPNDQYLCIVPDRKEKKLSRLYLPFEGDQLLSIIVSKAFLLAHDQKITDPVILEQLMD